MPVGEGGVGGSTGDHAGLGQRVPELAFKAGIHTDSDGELFKETSRALGLTGLILNKSIASNRAVEHTLLGEWVSEA